MNSLIVLCLKFCILVSRKNLTVLIWQCRTVSGSGHVQVEGQDAGSLRCTDAVPSLTSRQRTTWVMWISVRPPIQQRCTFHHNLPDAVLLVSHNEMIKNKRTDKNSKIMKILRDWTQFYCLFVACKFLAHFDLWHFFSVFQARLLYQYGT